MDMRADFDLMHTRVKLKGIALLAIPFVYANYCLLFMSFI